MANFGVVGFSCITLPLTFQFHPLIHSFYVVQRIGLYKYIYIAVLTKGDQCKISYGSMSSFDVAVDAVGIAAKQRHGIVQRLVSVLIGVAISIHALRMHYHAPKM